MSDSDKSRNTATGFITAVIVIFGFIFLTNGFYYHVQQGRQRDAAAEEYANQSADEIYNVCITGGGDTSTCRSEADKSKVRDSYTHYDLQAQQDMAMWGYGMFIAAIGTAFVTLGGVFYVALTLKATRDAVVEAGNATKAAEETVRVTRRLGEVSSAAYLGIEKVEVQFVPNVDDEDPERMCIYLYITVKNRGQTPAYRPRYSIRGGTCAGERDTLFFKESDPPGRFKTIGPQQEIVETFNMGQRDIPDEYLDAMLANDTVVFFSIEISYGLVFMRPNRSRKNGMLPREGYQKFFGGMDGPHLLELAEMERDWMAL